METRCTDCGRSHSVLATHSYVRFSGVTRSVVEPGEQLCSSCVALRRANEVRVMAAARNPGLLASRPRRVARVAQLLDEVRS